MKFPATTSFSFLSLTCLLLPRFAWGQPGGGNNGQGGGKPTDPPTSSPTSSPTSAPTDSPTSSPTSSPSSAPTVPVESCSSLTSIVWLNDGGIDCARPCCEEDAGVFTWPHTVNVDERIRIQSSSIINELHFPLLETAGIVRINYNSNLRSVSVPELTHANSIQFIDNDVLGGLDLPKLNEISNDEDDLFSDVDFKIQQNAALAYLTAPKLSAIKSDVDGATANLFVQDNDILTDFSFGSLSSITVSDGEANLFVRYNDALRQFSFPKLQSIIGSDGNYYGALIIDGNDMLTSFEFPLLSEIGPDTYSEYSVSGNAILEAVEMPALRFVNYIFFSSTPSLVDVRLPKWQGGGEESFLDFYGEGNCPPDKEAMVIRLCSLQSLEYGISFWAGGCYRIKGSGYAEGQCEAASACTVFTGTPNNCV